MSPRPLALEARGVSKRFGDVWANRAVDLRVEKGTIHAVVGENGAGKSTLMRLFAGLHAPDEGELFLNGRPLLRHSPGRAIALGLGMVHQHFMLVPTLTVAENVVLGCEPRRGGGLLGRLAGALGVVDRARAVREVAELGERFGLGVDPSRLAGDLSVGEAQRVEILKVLHRGAEVLILDEPTAVLTPLEADELFRVIGELRAAGKTTVLITHKLDEVMRASDRITVLRRGQSIAELSTASTTPEAIAAAMMGGQGAQGGEAEARRPPAAVRASEPVLTVDGLVVDRPNGSRAVDGISFTIAAGEILGVAGVEGNGQTELVEAILGLLSARAGRLRLGATDLAPLSTAARLALGVGFVPEDRHRQGLLLEMSVAENLLLGRTARVAGLGGRGPIDRRKALDLARAIIERFDIRPPDPWLPAAALSGGNQQKIVVGRALVEKPRLLVVAQPTRGVDVGAVALIHRELRLARDAGAAILLVSADLDELLALADRIAVVYNGRVVGTVAASEADVPRLGELMTGLGARRVEREARP